MKAANILIARAALTCFIRLFFFLLFFHLLRRRVVANMYDFIGWFRGTVRKAETPSERSAGVWDKRYADAQKNSGELFCKLLFAANMEGIAKLPWDTRAPDTR